MKIEIDKCPYCGANVKLVSNDYIYGKQYGNGYVYICVNYPIVCDAYVGTHPNKMPLGILANKELRELKKIAHELFDKRWLNSRNRRQARKKAYEWLSHKMKIPYEDCHIGYFGIEQTKKVIKLCSK